MCASDLGLALLASLASGIWLWWPRKASAKAWRAALWPRLRPLQGAAPWRGLHNAGAGWLLLPLLVITATGVWLARPDWFGASARSSIKPVLSALHGALMLGTAGQALALAAGLALPLLYATGLAMWLRRRGLSKT